MIALGIGWFFLFAGWLLFVFQISASEMIAGAVGAAAAAASGWIVFRVVPVCFEPRLRWILQIWHIPRAAVRDLWSLLKYLWSELRGKPHHSLFRTMPFVVTGESCRAATQRALVTLLVSVTPNSVVVAIDQQTGDMLLHQLEPAEFPKIVRALEK